MSRVLSFFLVAMLAIVTFGCQPSSREGSVKGVRLNMSGEPQSLDPRKARQLNSLSVIHLLFDGLLREGKEGKVELAVAERVDISADLMTYTFHLKPTFWSNADPVTAEDFAYAWKQILSPEFPSGLAALLYDIKNAKAVKEGSLSMDVVGIVALDAKTLQVTLEHPTPYFLELVAQPLFSPVNQKVEKENANWAQRAPSYVSNGPFSLAEWKHQDQIVLKKNPSYWDAACVHLEFLRFDMVTEETELKLFEKQELDWAGSPLSRLPLEALKSLSSEGCLKAQPVLSTVFLRVNTQDPVLSNVLMRRALALAINRGAIAEHVTRGGQRPATGLVPLSFQLQKEPYFQDADLLVAKIVFEQALAQMGLSVETLPEVTYLYGASERNHLIAQAIQQQWLDALGFRVKLEALEPKVFFSRVSKQDYQIAYGDWVADFSDPINFLEVFKYKKGGSNNTLWENAQYASLLDQSSKISAGEERRSLLSRAEKILMEEMPIIPLLYPNMLYITQPYLKDVVLSSAGQIDFKWASIEGTR